MCLRQFLPELRLAAAKVRPLPSNEKKALWGNAVGTVGKFLYGFLWQASIYVLLLLMYFMKANLGILDNGDMIWPIVLTGEGVNYRGPPILVRP